MVLSSSQHYVEAETVNYRIRVNDHALGLIRLLEGCDKEFAQHINNDLNLRLVTSRYIQGDLRLRDLNGEDDAPALRTAILTAERGIKNRARFAVLQKKLLQKYSSVLRPLHFKQHVFSKVNQEIVYALKLSEPFVGEFEGMEVLVEHLRGFLREDGISVEDGVDPSIKQHGASAAGGQSTVPMVEDE